MKKFFMILLVAVVPFISVCGKSNNPVRLFKGTLAALKDVNAKGFVEIDYSKTKIEGKPLVQWLDSVGMSMKQFQANDSERIRYFSEKWEDDMKRGMSLTSNRDEADYIVRIRIRKFNYGMDAAGGRSGSSWNWSGVQGGGASISGYVDIVKKDSESLECTLEVLEMNGTIMGTVYRGEHGILRIFNDLGEDICKVVNKAK